ncbi:hypothetical protein GW17_00050106 [Ensete ventricosum]|nr:hypothetical protein GW17_00050106 [Ensete ventricosum]
MARPAAAKAPYKGAAGHGQSPLQGQLPTCATARGHGRCLQGRLPATWGNPATRVVACKGGHSCRGSAHARWYHLPARCHPRAAAPAAEAAADTDGV